MDLASRRPGQSALRRAGSDVGRCAGIAARALLRGAVLIEDERVALRFSAPVDESERLFYGYSILFCLPNGLADSPSVGTGTILRPSALEAMAHQAGFGQFTILPIEHDAFRFYRLDP